MLVPVDEGLLLWQAGDPAAETGVSPAGFAVAGQCWFSSAGWNAARQVCTPSASGTFTGTGGMTPALGWFEIDTECCDVLAITYAGKLVASTGYTAVASSTIRALAQGMFAYHPDFPARRKPFVTRADFSGLSTGQDMCHLSCFGGAGPAGSAAREDTYASIGNDLVLRALLHTSGAAPANDYHAWQFSVGHRQGMPNQLSSASGLITTLPIISGIRRVWVAILHIPSVTGGSSVSLYGQLHAQRFYISPSSRV